MTAEETPSEAIIDESHRLLLAVRAGESSALGKLAQKIRPFLKFVIRKELGDQAKALPDDDSDLVQQSLVHALENLDGFRGQTVDEWRAWLATIARNQARDARRYWAAKRRSLTKRLPLEGERSLASKGEYPWSNLEHREQAARLQLIIDRLPPEKQPLVRWRRDEGLSHEEIAAKLGISVNAARQSWKMTLDELRRAWKNHGD